VLGKRGAWVAAQNPAWKFALLAGTEAADRRLWDEGDSMQRAAFLYELRQTDPSGARTLLEQAFRARLRALVPSFCLDSPGISGRMMNRLLRPYFPRTEARKCGKSHRGCYRGCSTVSSRGG
jgi:hypothetical protein